MLEFGFYNMDCMQGMKEFPDKYFDLAIVDPPYGLNIDGQKQYKSKTNPKHNRKLHLKRNWDYKIPDEQYFEELKRVSKNQIVFGANYFTDFLEKGHKGWIVWYKGQQDLTMSDCEIAYSNFDTPSRIVIINRVEQLKENTIHPTQKPIALYQWILNRYAKEGDKILDTHVGSASSLIACHRAGLDYVGFELDEYYYNLAKERLEKEKQQIIMDFE